jgi:hypothetical protein
MYCESCAGIFKQSMGARNKVGLWLSYRPARLHNLAEIGFLESILGHRKSLKIRVLGRAFLDRLRNCCGTPSICLPRGGGARFTSVRMGCFWREIFLARMWYERNILAGMYCERNIFSWDIVGEEYFSRDVL